MFKNRDIDTNKMEKKHPNQTRILDQKYNQKGKEPIEKTQNPQNDQTGNPKSQKDSYYELIKRKLIEETKPQVKMMRFENYVKYQQNLRSKISASLASEHEHERGTHPRSQQPQPKFTLGFDPQIARESNIIDIFRQSQKAEISRSKMSVYIENLKGDCKPRKYESIVFIRRLILADNLFATFEVIDLGGIPVLMQIVEQSEELTMRIEAMQCLYLMIKPDLCILTNLMDFDIVNCFGKKLKGGTLTEKYMAILGLRNLVKYSESAKMEILKTDISKQLNLMLKKKNFKFKNQLLECVCYVVNFYVTKDTTASLRNLVISLIMEFIQTGDENLQRVYLQSVYLYTETEYFRYFSSHQLLNRLKEMYIRNLNDSECAESKNDFRAIHHIISSLVEYNDEARDRIIDLGFVPLMIEILPVDDRHSKIQILGIFMSLTRISEDFIRTCIGSGNFLGQIMNQIFLNDEKIRECLFEIVHNIIKMASRPDFRILIESLIFHFYSDLLDETENFGMIMQVLLLLDMTLKRSLVFDVEFLGYDRVKNLIAQSGIYVKLEQLQSLESNHIYFKINDLIEKYFDEDFD